MCLKISVFAMAMLLIAACCSTSDAQRVRFSEGLPAANGTAIPSVPNPNLIPPFSGAIKSPQSQPNFGGNPLPNLTGQSNSTLPNFPEATPGPNIGSQVPSFGPITQPNSTLNQPFPTQQNFGTVPGYPANGAPIQVPVVTPLGTPAYPSQDPNAIRPFNLYPGGNLQGNFQAPGTIPPTTVPPAQFAPLNTRPQLLPPTGTGGFPPQNRFPNPAPPTNTRPSATIQPPVVQSPGVAQPARSWNWPSWNWPNWNAPNLNWPGSNGSFGSPNLNYPQVNIPQWSWPQGSANYPQYRVNPPNEWFNNWSYMRGVSANTRDWFASRDWYNTAFWSNFQQGRYRLLQDVRVTETWLHGDSGNQVDIHDFELGTSLLWPNLFNGNVPLRVSPGFIFHFWDGPQAPIAQDLPSRAYSAFLQFDYNTPEQAQFGLDLNVSLGVYSDFDAVTSDAYRFKGLNTMRYRVAPDVVFRLGAAYLDRVRVKLLPAIGFFWTPSNDARIDMFFPYPKISRRLPSIGNSDVWAYVRGEYGGDSWAIRRASGLADQVDINDYRVVAGMDWTGARGSTGFFEVGYVFERELQYRSSPLSDVELDDTFMIRVGFVF